MCLSRIGQIVYGALSLTSVGLIIGSVFTPAWRQVTSNLQNGQINQLPPLNMGLFAFACQRNTNQQPLQQQYGNNYATVGYGNNNGYNAYTAANNLVNQGVNTLTNNGYNGVNTLNNQLQQQAAGYNTGGTAVTINTATGTRYLDLCIEWWNNQPVFEKVVIVLMILALVSAAASFVWNLLTICACFCHGSILKPLPGLASMAFVCLLLSVIIYWSQNNSSINQLQTITNIQSINEQSDVSYSFYLACGAALASLANVIVGVLIVFLADKCL